MKVEMRLKKQGGREDGNWHREEYGQIYDLLACQEENKTRNLLTSLEDRKKEKRYCDFCSIIKSLFSKSGLEPVSQDTAFCLHD